VAPASTKAKRAAHKFPSPICVSLGAEPLEKIKHRLAHLAFAEIRMDRLGATPETAREIFGRHPNLIATYRQCDSDDGVRERSLLAAIASGAKLVDVDIREPPRLRDAIVKATKERNAFLILSYHEFARMPEESFLSDLAEECFSAGADYVKLACMVRTGRDLARLVGLLDDDRPIIPVGMGTLGLQARVAALLAGAAFTYAAPEPDYETAEGQPDLAALSHALEAVRLEWR